MKFSKSKVILCYIILNVVLTNVPVKANTPLTISPLKDTFILNTYPATNEGDAVWLLVCDYGGIYLDTCHTLIHFELPYDYMQYDFIKFHFYVYLASLTAFNIDIYRVIESYNEMTVTWFSYPMLGEYLFSYTLNDLTEYFIDIKEYLYSEEFSICIMASTYQDNLCQIPSRESGYRAIELPYIELSGKNNNWLLNVFTVIFSILGVVGVIVLVLQYRRKLIRKKTEPKEIKIEPNENDRE
jgi:hypothetical protein